MTPAEFRSLREYLGLSTQWMAMNLGVGQRAVVRWETPGEKVPEHAAELLAGMRTKAHAEVDLVPTVAGGQTLYVPASTVWNSLRDPMPPAWHRHLAIRVADKLKSNVTAIDYGPYVPRAPRPGTSKHNADHPRLDRA